METKGQKKESTGKIQKTGQEPLEKYKEGLTRVHVECEGELNAAAVMFERIKVEKSSKSCSRSPDRFKKPESWINIQKLHHSTLL